MSSICQIVTLNQFDPHVILFLVILVVMLLISAFVSGSETSLFSLSPADLDTINKSDTSPDKSIVRLLSDQDTTLATILIMNNLINIGIVILSNNILNRIITFTGAPIWEFLIKVIIVTFLLLLFGEIMPKIYASYNPMRFARIISVPLTAFNKLLRPFSYILVRSGNRLNESVSRKKSNISLDELSDAIEITENHSDEEKQILTGIVGFANTDVAEIMKLRIDIVALSLTDDFESVKRTIIKSGFSRIPAYDETIDNIKGVLYVKDMLPYIERGADFPWQNYLREAYYVPENKKISDLLEEFQTGKVHMAIVVDEYGATQGLVSLEDIIEEIVGEITDETDVEQPTFYKKIDDSTYIFDGKTHLYDLERVLGLDEDYFEDVSGGSETIAGLMLEINRDFMKKGDRVSAKGISFTVTALDGRRIDKVRIVVFGPESSADNAAGL